MCTVEWQISMYPCYEGFQISIQGEFIYISAYRNGRIAAGYK
jgi:hypothetical protein